jgi:transposase
VIQLVPHLRVLVAREPVDFRKGIDSLGGVCRQVFAQDPFSGALFVFRNRTGTAIKLLVYDGQGFWLCQKRLSKGRFQWWPPSAEGLMALLPAEELSVLLYNGRPRDAAMAAPWRRISSPWAPPVAIATAASPAATPAPSAGVARRR